MGESCTVARKSRVRAGALCIKKKLHTEDRRIAREGKQKTLFKEPRKKHERVSGHKDSPGGTEKSWFNRLAKSEMGNDEIAHKMSHSNS